MAKFYAKAPDGTDATLSITVEGFTQSLQQNGWCKMPNGLILQWLKAADYKNTENSYSEPFIIQPNEIYLAIVSTENCRVDSLGYADGMLQYLSTDNDNCNFFLQSFYGATTMEKMLKAHILIIHI